MIDVYDDVLTLQDAQYISEFIKAPNFRWNYYHKSERDVDIYHWSRFAGNNEKQIKNNGFLFLIPMWENLMYNVSLREKYGITRFRRIYFNAHTYGVEPQAHIDDGELTMMYYPRIDWEEEWGGGTAIWNDEGTEIEKLVEYKGNRLIIFPAIRLHQAQPVSRNCYHLRSIIVFKTILSSMKEWIEEISLRNNLNEYGIDKDFHKIQYLENIGADEVMHNEKYTLLNHLIGVNNILKKLNAPEYIQDAGLFHSVYGTTFFKPKMVQDRDEVKRLIGEEAEELAYLFCNLGRPRYKEILKIEDEKKRWGLRLIWKANMTEMKMKNYNVTEDEGQYD